MNIRQDPGGRVGPDAKIRNGFRFRLSAGGEDVPRNECTRAPPVGRVRTLLVVLSVVTHRPPGRCPYRQQEPCRRRAPVPPPPARLAFPAPQAPRAAPGSRHLGLRPPRMSGRAGGCHPTWPPPCTLGRKDPCTREKRFLNCKCCVSPHCIPIFRVKMRSGKRLLRNRYTNKL